MKLWWLTTVLKFDMSAADKDFVARILMAIVSASILDHASVPRLSSVDCQHASCRKPTSAAVSSQDFFDVACQFVQLQQCLSYSDLWLRAVLDTVSEPLDWPHAEGEWKWKFSVCDQGSCLVARFVRVSRDSDRSPSIFMFSSLSPVDRFGLCHL